MGTQDRGFSAVWTLKEKEENRLKQQIKLDMFKDMEERRRLGQYATPPELAREIAAYGLKLFANKDKIRFLEPAFGTGAFYSALLSELQEEQLEFGVGYEIDSVYAKAAKEIWGEQILIRNADFTRGRMKKNSINLLLSNPPYVRYHYIPPDDKVRMNHMVYQKFGFRLSGLADLFCYFMLLAHSALEQGAICGWLIPGGFMDANYGHEIKRYLLNDVHLLRIHSYRPENLLFEDALVSSSVVWFKNEKITEDYMVEFSLGGTHENPEVSENISRSHLLLENKWSHFPGTGEKEIFEQSTSQIKDFFTVKRGLATGDNGFFILTREQIEENGLKMDYFIPILPSPRYLKVSIIECDSAGYPILDNIYYLLKCTLEEDVLREQEPELWSYLQSGINHVSKKYLCKSRRIWYFQESREPAPILCTYMGRSVSVNGNPFRFILNHSKAVATNSYLMLYPKPIMKDILEKRPDFIIEVWECLNTISMESIESEGRIYGGGLKKIEPKELGEVKCGNLQRLLYKMTQK